MRYILPALGLLAGGLLAIGLCIGLAALVVYILSAAIA